MVVLDYGTTMKGAAYLAVNPMGQSADEQAQRWERDRMRGCLRLSGGRLP
jgi:hypothetical protein